MASLIKAVVTEEHLLRPRQEGLSKKIMLRPESKAEWTSNVFVRQFQVASKI